MNLLKNKWLVLILGVISLGLAIVMLPSITTFGQNILYIVTAIALLIYAIAFLLRNISKKNAKSITFWLETSEIVIVFLIAVGLVLVQFNIFNFEGVSYVVAFVVWLRGIVGTIRAKDKVWQELAFLALTSIGAYFLARPLAGDDSILIAVAIIFFAFALFCGIRFYQLHKKSAPKKKEKIKTAPSDKVEDVKNTPIEKVGETEKNEKSE